MAQDFDVKKLKINVLSKEQMAGITSPAEDELYFVEEDIDAIPTEGSTNPVESGGMYDALQGKQDTLTAGEGIKIEGNVISNTQTSAEWGNIQGNISAQTDLNNTFATKAELNTKSSVIIRRH